MKNLSIQEVLIHGAKGEPRYDSRTASPILIDYAEVLYAKSLCTYPEIYDKVKIKAEHHGLAELTIDHLKKHFRQIDVQNRLRPKRNGKEWYDENIAKQQHFTMPEYAGQLLEIDGSRLQIPFNNVKLRKIDFLVLFVILDVTSRLILRNAHGLSEKSKVAKNAFRRIFERHSFLPLQIIREGASTYDRDFTIVESLTIDTSLPAERLIRVLEKTIFWRGKPQRIRTDNGPEFISNTLKTWCYENQIELTYIQPGKPMQNSYIERFNGIYRRDILDDYLFDSLESVRERTIEFAEDYNLIRGHDSLSKLSPVQYLKNQTKNENYQNEFCKYLEN